MSNWKKTSEELPEDNQYVAFEYGDGDYTYIGWYDEESRGFSTDEIFPSFFDAETIEAWCPIPEYDIS